MTSISQWLVLFRMTHGLPPLNLVLYGWVGCPLHNVIIQIQWGRRHNMRQREWNPGHLVQSRMRYSLCHRKGVIATMIIFHHLNCSFLPMFILHNSISCTGHDIHILGWLEEFVSAQEWIRLGCLSCHQYWIFGVRSMIHRMQVVYFSR